mmetsp:Transcript_49481/g.111263  ORF Transcript_49481/g.111263 Transcript_49481/m.111263 type:complete len:244 (-) Transcript_49481:301-1032(-)
MRPGGQRGASGRVGQLREVRDGGVAEWIREDGGRCGEAGGCGRGEPGLHPRGSRRWHQRLLRRRRVEIGRQEAGQQPPGTARRGWWQRDAAAHRRAYEAGRLGGFRSGARCATGTPPTSRAAERLQVTVSATARRGRRQSSPRGGVSSGFRQEGEVSHGREGRQLGHRRAAESGGHRRRARYRGRWQDGANSLRALQLALLVKGISDVERLAHKGGRCAPILDVLEQRTRRSSFTVVDEAIAR